MGTPWNRGKLLKAVVWAVALSTLLYVVAGVLLVGLL